jgi:hypothetical protein
MNTRNFLKKEWSNLMLLFNSNLYSTLFTSVYFGTATISYVSFFLLPFPVITAEFENAAFVIDTQ